MNEEKKNNFIFKRCPPKNCKINCHFAFELLRDILFEICRLESFAFFVALHFLLIYFFSTITSACKNFVHLDKLFLRLSIYQWLLSESWVYITFVFFCRLVVLLFWWFVSPVERRWIVRLFLSEMCEWPEILGLWLKRVQWIFFYWLLHKVSE